MLSTSVDVHHASASTDPAFFTGAAQQQPDPKMPS